MKKLIFILWAVILPLLTYSQNSVGLTASQITAAAKADGSTPEYSVDKDGVGQVSYTDLNGWYHLHLLDKNNVCFASIIGFYGQTKSQLQDALYANGYSYYNTVIREGEAVDVYQNASYKAEISYLLTAKCYVMVFKEK